MQSFSRHCTAGVAARGFTADIDFQKECSSVEDDELIDDNFDDPDYQDDEIAISANKYVSAAGNYIDDRISTKIVEAWRSFLSFLGLTKSREEIQSEKEAYFKTIANEVRKAKICDLLDKKSKNPIPGCRAIKVKNLTFIEMIKEVPTFFGTTKREAYIYIRDAHNVVIKIPRPMSLENIIAKANNACNDDPDGFSMTNFANKSEASPSDLDFNKPWNLADTNYEEYELLGYKIRFNNTPM